MVLAQPVMWSHSIAEDSGKRPADSIESVPEETTVPDLSFNVRSCSSVRPSPDPDHPATP